MGTTILTASIGFRGSGIPSVPSKGYMGQAGV